MALSKRLGVVAQPKALHLYPPRLPWPGSVMARIRVRVRVRVRVSVRREFFNMSDPGIKLG